MTLLDNPKDAAIAALSLTALYFALAFGLRTLLQLRRTGSSGFHGVSGRVGSAEWIGGVSFAVAIVLGVAGPVLQATGTLTPVSALDSVWLRLVGIALALVGIGATLAAQLAMGASWRIGVDESERTELVTHGPFAIVRNPIFAAMLPTSLGLTLLAPTWPALLGFAVLLLALELQTRAVEEPYLLRVHGPDYAGYAGRVGRFFPGVGRLNARTD